MLRILLLCSAASAACTPSPQDDTMRKPSPPTGTIAQGLDLARPNGDGSASSSLTGQDAGDPARAAQGPIPAAVSAAENPASLPAPADSPTEAVGRRILSTAFVRLGPDGHLTVELSDGHELVLRNVVMRPKDYCGLYVAGGPDGTKYCGRYADVAAARPGGPVPPVEPGPPASNPLVPERGPSRHN